MLKVALPNGTMEKQAVKLFESLGIDLRKNHRQYQVKISNSRVALVTFMRPHIIPHVVGNGSYDLGITGSDCVAEADDCPPVTLAKIKYGKTNEHDWRLVLFGGQDDPASSLKEIKDNATILSEYPRITQLALHEAGKRAKIHFSHGTTEANVPRDFPYGVGITSSGITLKVNRLKIIAVLSHETAVIIGGPGRLEKRDKELASISLVSDLIRYS